MRRSRKYQPINSLISWRRREEELLRKRSRFGYNKKGGGGGRRVSGRPRPGSNETVEGKEGIDPLNVTQ